VRALTVQPGSRGSVAVTEVAEPPGRGTVLVQTLDIGICGTDLEIAAGDYGQPPEGEHRLVMGHESLGRVVTAPPSCGLRVGDLVVGIVRRPDPVPCSSCALGEWDMCRNGRYTERGIKGRHGYAVEQYRIQPDFVVAVPSKLGHLGVLVEPTSVVAKAWEHLERIGARAHWQPRTVAITGAGPIGLLAALLGVQRGLDVHVVDVVEDGPKPELVTKLGAEYHTTPITQLGFAPDIVIECSGVPGVVLDVLSAGGSDAVICLTGVSPTGRRLSLDLGAVGREIVLQNDAIFGSVNANRRHYEQAVRALVDADSAWLQGLITRRIPLDRFQEALERRPDDVKVVLHLPASG
jgi:glucose 1-dehydrogenase